MNPSTADIGRIKPIYIKGFTLIELLIAIGILGILAAFASQGIMSAIENSRKAACVSNLRQIGAATMVHVAEYGGRLPGQGKLAQTSTATWQDAISALMAGMSGKRVVQRLGDKPIKGQIYCPSMKPWKGGGSRWPRAYVANQYAFSDPLVTSSTENAPPGLTDYKPGRMISAFSRPSKTVLIFESERDADAYTPPFNANAPVPIILANGRSGPAWASTDQTFAFRHQGVMNVLYLDGHVEGLTLERAQDLNQNYYFKPD